jgi:hypothetical protein
MIQESLTLRSVTTCAVSVPLRRPILVYGPRALHQALEMVPPTTSCRTSCGSAA